MSAASKAQASQAGLVLALQPFLAAAWQQLDQNDVEGSLPAFVALVQALVRRYGLASAALAAQYYDTERATAGVGRVFTVIPAALPPLAQIQAAVGWATSPLTAPGPRPADALAAPSAAFRNFTGAVEKMTLDVGRQTVIDSAKRDRKARGWARIPEPGCCSFCALLATRGAVYKEDTVGFRSHDHCRCHAEPVFNAYEPSAEIRGWQQQYRQATSGLSGKASLIAWRQSFEGRTPDPQVP